MKAVFLDFATMGSGLDLKELECLVSELVIHDDSPDDTIAERIADADIVFTNKIRLTRVLLEHAPKLKFIALTATGTDNIDTNCAKQHGIAVANIRHYCTRSVVEHVFGVLLSLTHSLGQYHRSVRAGDWQRATDFCMLHHPVRELSSMTLGVLGYGALGQGVARIGRKFGMRIIVAARPGAERVPEDRVGFDRLLADADVISLHCPLTPETHHLIDETRLALARPGLVVVNTSVQIPHVAISVSPNVSEEVRDKLRNALLEADKNEEGQALLKKLGFTNFEPADPSGYAGLMQYLIDFSFANE